MAGNRASKNTNIVVISAATKGEVLPNLLILINTQETPTPKKPIPNKSPVKNAFVAEEYSQIVNNIAIEINARCAI